MDNVSSKDHAMFAPGEWVTLTHGRYRIEGERSLGEGGQSAVWKAVQESDGKTVVIRTVNLFDLGSDSRLVRTHDEIEGLLHYAEEEIRFLEKIGHTDAAQHFILPVLDKGNIQHPLTSRPLPTTAMQWYEGGDLGQYVCTRKQHKTFTATELLRWMRQLATALLYIHQQHDVANPSVHRDVKPKNIVLSSKGDIALTDFGIVRAAASLGTSSVVGSALYCAPEQVLATHRSASRHKQYLITPATDIYSLAITLHELVSGQTDAQRKLTAKTNGQNLPDVHDSYLPPVGVVQTGPIGELGKVGGLSTGEEVELRKRLLALLQGEKAGLTLPLGSVPRLPDAAFIANELAVLLKAMLAPWPADRPSTAEVLAAFTVMEQCLTPTLEWKKLPDALPDLTLGQSCSLAVKLKGEGLPATLHWLRLEVDGKPQSVEWHWEGKANYGVFPTDIWQTVQAAIPLPESTGQYAIRLLAQVGSNTLSQTTQCRVTLTAQQLWGLGKYEGALRLELRLEWLESLLKQATTLNERIKLRDLLQGLQSYYPFDPEQKLLQDAMDKVDRMGVDAPQVRPRSRWKVWTQRLLMLVLGVVLLALVYKNYMDYNRRITNLEQQSSKHLQLSEQTLIGLKSIENSPDVDVQRSYLHDLRELAASGHPNIQSEAQRLLDSYFEGAYAGYESDTAEGARLALARSTILAEEQKPEAMMLLGMLYISGKSGGVVKDAQLGCDWLKKAGVAGYDLTKVKYDDICRE